MMFRPSATTQLTLGWIQPKSNYFGEIPHADLIRCIARRVSDGRMLGW